jgi:CHASE2 domain-containing sensor protein
VFSQLQQKFVQHDLISAAVILVIIAVVLHTSQLFSRIDNLIFDIGQRVIQIAPPNDVILIAIDQDSLAQIGRWPWSRQVHADLLQRLQSEAPAVVGFDVIFSEAEKTNPSADIALAKAISASQKVVLPVLLENVRGNGQVIETLPLPALVAHAADIGRVHAVLDEDSIARSVYLHEGLGAPVWQLFAQAVLNVAEKKPTQNQFNHTQANQNAFGLVRTDQRRVNYLGPPGHFHHISYAQVLRGEFEPGLFNNKIVLVGATALGMNDLLTTPVSGLGLPMAGVEFHANVLASIRQHQLIQSPPFWVSTLIVLALSVLPLIWLPKVSALHGFISTLVFMCLVALLFGLLPRISAVWVPPAATLCALLLAYPIWSWRKLEAAQRFLDFELQYLKQNLISMPLAHQPQTDVIYDQFDARIAKVRAASQQLRYLNEDRKETLAFISHDLRAPIAVALMVLEQHPNLKSTLHQPLSQALFLAEDFLQASRAEMMDITQFNEVDIAGLVHQAIDDAYDAASQKNILLVREVTDDVVWVKGHFGLLHRAMLNLILNAVKYSPAKSKVIVRLALNPEKSEAIFSVTDHGPGIAKAEQAHLFKRFSRVKAHEKLAEGAGLGLYFVRTVVEKHQGEIAVQSDLGMPTTFCLHLPVLDSMAHPD